MILQDVVASVGSYLALSQFVFVGLFLGWIGQGWMVQAVIEVCF